MPLSRSIVLADQDQIGSIAPDKQADFALLDRDVLTVVPRQNSRRL
jgi:predicted amidohydrolase YtcJ